MNADFLQDDFVKIRTVALYGYMETTYTKARENLATLLDRAVDDKDVIIIKHRGNRDVALIDAAELASLMETAYLLRSPQNAARLLNPLEWSKSRDLQPVKA